MNQDKKKSLKAIKKRQKKKERDIKKQKRWEGSFKKVRDNMTQTTTKNLNSSKLKETQGSKKLKKN